MRVWPDHVRMNKRRPNSSTTMRNCMREGAKTHNRIGAIDLFKMEIRKARNQARNISIGSLNFDRNGDRVAIVFNEKYDRQSQVGGSIQRFPELALAGGAIAKGNIGNLIAVKLNIFEFAIVPARLLPSIRVEHEIAAGFGATDRMKNLSAGAGRLSYDIEPLVSPVRWHLPPTGTGIFCRTHCLEKHFIRSDPQRQTERAIAVIRKEPVVARLHCQACRNRHRLVA